VTKKKGEEIITGICQENLSIRLKSLFANTTSAVQLQLTEDKTFASNTLSFF